MAITTTWRTPLSLPGRFRTENMNWATTDEMTPAADAPLNTETQNMTDTQTAWTGVP